MYLPIKNSKILPHAIFGQHTALKKTQQNYKNNNTQKQNKNNSNNNYHSDNETENLYHSHKPTPFESLQNLHASIEAAMESFYQVTQEGDLGLVSLWREEVESEKNLQ